MINWNGLLAEHQSCLCGDDEGMEAGSVLGSHYCEASGYFGALDVAI